MGIMIYLDNNSTTRVDPIVVEAMLPYFSQWYGNSASSTHEMGRQARQAVEDARQVIANSIGASAEEIYFTSGATESNNLAIRGACTHRSTRSKRIVTLASEHRAVLDPVKRLAQEGFQDHILTPSPEPAHFDTLSTSLVQPAALVSIMIANNEIGTVCDIGQLASVLDSSTIFHTDAAQALGKVDIDVSQTPIHLLSLSAHKIYGPKGVGALYVRRGTRLKPVLEGGGHEKGKRSGTLNVAGIVGFAKAVEILMESRSDEETKIRSLMEHTWERLKQEVCHVQLNGPAIESRLLGNLNFQVEGVDAETLTLNLPEVCLSTGSACTSAEPGPSHVLQAIGLDETQARSSVRLGIGRFNTRQEIDSAVEQIADAVKQLRN